ncbi:hypothetical protein HZH66_006095 [Vespula vulgaris]|uniref:Uncharacterized protein n=1 Tax=Vespula vulgaris TaxID=7454 RepID=A0A834K6B6_VESVU|nr:hypothetical protein HZH66_006095 [Vespula vulgaris]
MEVPVSKEARFELRARRGPSRVPASGVGFRRLVKDLHRLNVTALNRNEWFIQRLKSQASDLVSVILVFILINCPQRKLRQAALHTVIYGYFIGACLHGGQRRCPEIKAGGLMCLCHEPPPPPPPPPSPSPSLSTSVQAEPPARATSTLPVSLASTFYLLLHIHLLLFEDQLP